jgi:hypothetical protein
MAKLMYDEKLVQGSSEHPSMPDPVFINIGKPPRGMATEINKVK